jgi:predicted phosphodiesterase
VKVALVSDIHGNAVALEAVLDDLAGRAVDRIVCLGDVAAGGPRPREASDRVRSLGCASVVGNWEAIILNWFVAASATAEVNDIGAWGASQIDDATRAYLSSFVPTVSVALDAEASLLCFHGSPRSHSDVILPTTPDQALAELLSDPSAVVLAGGHTHVQMLRPYRNALIVNPGTVGARLRLPTHRRPIAEYSVIEWRDGVLAVDLRRVPYDANALARSAMESGMPHARWWLMRLGAIDPR